LLLTPAGAQTDRSVFVSNGVSRSVPPKTSSWRTNVMRPTTFAGKTVLVTGANRGLGQALLAEALRRGARCVYAGTRQPFGRADERVTPLRLDVTDRAQIQAAFDPIEALDILINNAGVSVPDDLNDRSAFERHLAVNLYGTLDVTQAALPLLTRS